MRSFLAKTAVIFIVVISLMLCLDAFITHRLHHSRASMLVGMNDVFFDSTNYDVVIMGSSRALVQYDTRILDTILNKNCYNLGIDGRGMISQIIKYIAYEKRHGRPKVIIHNIDCFLLDEDNGYEREQYLPYLFDKELFDAIYKREDFTIFDSIIPLIRYAGYEQMIREGLGLSNKMDKSGMYKGYRPNYSIWDGRMLEATVEVGFGCDPVVVSAFKRFLIDCRGKGIKLVFVYAPFFSGARCKMSDEKQKAMFDSFDRIAEEYQIPLLSWWDCPISEDTAYFYNATHLNADGAKLFTQELALSLDSMNLFERDDAAFKKDTIKDVE